MSKDLIIEHKDGRRYGVTREGFHKLYEAEGFKIVGEETPAAFALVGVPKPRRVRPKPKAKAVAKPVAVVAPAPEEPA